MPQTGGTGAAKLTAGALEKIGRCLAHVVLNNQGEEMVLGQAWLAAPGMLITCGHVVDQFVLDPGALHVKFPAAGLSYPVSKIKLHPNFVRQPDKLVKFDLALLTVKLKNPQSGLVPLSFAYEQELRNDRELTAIRYPVHLSHLTDAPEPVLQSGKVVGRLNKLDQFHLLHDLALAPGDSGTALFDGARVVAIHCGDTASLPGLNLPTTAIRLALSIDAARDLSLSETASALLCSKNRQLVRSIFAFLTAAFVAGTLTLLALLSANRQPWAVAQPSVEPVDIRFNEPVLGYKANERVSIELSPRKDCNMYLFDVDEQNRVFCAFPMPGFSPFIKGGQKRMVSKFGNNYLTAGPSKDKLHLVALITNDPLVKDTDWSKVNPAGSPLTMNADALMTRIKDFERLEPESILHVELDAPRAL